MPAIYFIETIVKIVKEVSEAESCVLDTVEACFRAQDFNMRESRERNIE